MDDTKVKLTVDEKQAIKALDAFEKKLLNLNKVGDSVGKGLAKGIESGLAKLSGNLGNQFTRDVNKSFREAAVGSGDTFAKKFGQSMRSSLQPQLTQLRKDIEKSVSGIKPPTVNLPSVNSSGASAPSGSAFSGLGGAVVVANQALELFQKGVSAATAAYETFSDTIQRGQEVVNLSTAFDNLQASVGRGPNALELFREATKGLVSDLDLFRSANQAVILGVDKGSESFLELATNAIKLGRAMGIDAKASLDSIVIGIGRESKLILDNLGIVVETTKAHETYAATIGKTTEQLTDAEKRLAFYNATVDAVNKRVGSLPEITLNAGEAFTILGNSAENTFNEFARGIVENSNLALALQNLAGSTESIDFAGLATEVAEAIAKFINFAAVITETVAPALNGLKDILAFFNSSESVGELTRQFEKTGMSAVDAYKAAENSIKNMDSQVAATKDRVNQLREELGKIKTAEGTELKIIELKELKQLAEADLALNKTATAAAKTKQEIGFIDKAISAATAKLLGFAKQGEDAGENNAKALKKAKDEAEKFEKALSAGIAEIKVLGRSDSELNFVALAAKGIGEAIVNNTISADELDRVLRDLAEEGIKNNLSLADTFGLVKKSVTDTKQELQELDNLEKTRQKRVQELQRQYSQTGFGRAAIGLDNLFGTDFQNSFYKDLEDANGKIDPERLAAAIGFNAQLESAIGSVIANGLIEGIQSFGSGQLGTSLGGTFGSLLGSYFGPIGAAVGGEFGEYFGKEAEKSINEFGKDTKSTIDSIAFAVDTVFPGVGSAIAKGLEGLGIGKKDPFSQARKAFKQYLDFIRDETKGFNFLGDGDIIGLKPEMLESLALPQSVLDSYTNLGNALSLSPQLAEITEGLDGIGTQFGEILAINFENVGGLNALQLALQGANISAEELGQSLEDAYFRGKLQAGDFLVQNSAIQDLFAVGIPGAIGAADVAFQNFVTNGTRSGQDAQDAIRDIVAEAYEFAEANGINIRSVQDLSNILVNSLGQNLGEVTQVFNELGNIGLDTIEEIQNISVIDTAQLVNNLQNTGFAFRDVTAGVQDAITQIEEFKRTASQEVVTDWKINVKVEGDQIPEQIQTQTGLKMISGPSLR